MGEHVIKINICGVRLQRDIMRITYNHGRAWKHVYFGTNMHTYLYVEICTMNALRNIVKIQVEQNN